MTDQGFSDILHRAPKVLLHDHLDGGLRPSTVIELASEYGYESLPTTDVDELATWFNRGAKRNDLVLYLETFAHTVGVMQQRDAIERLPARDREVLPFVVEHADAIALSFVRRPEDVVALQEELRGYPDRNPAIVVKVETERAYRKLPQIILAAMRSYPAGLMIARGDMGVELGPEAVPALQKRIIRLARDAKKPVITATQMLESMVTSPRPTRAEASDVANAVLDGSWALMLSAETATGEYPVRTVQMMEYAFCEATADARDTGQIIDTGAPNTLQAAEMP